MATDVKTQRPLPLPNELTEGFWEAARDHRLAVQRCNTCGTYHHPPVPMCTNCRSSDLAFADVSGRGRIVATTIVRASRIESMAGQSLVLIGVELEEQEGLVLMANLVEAPAEEARVGLPVTVAFEEIGEGYLLPQFKPGEGA